MARFICAALCVVAFACVYSFPVRANEPQVGTGLVCDTKEQVALFASLAEEKGAQGALAAVNDDAGTPNACVIASVMFVIVERLDAVQIGGRPYNIVKILIGGVATPAGMQPVEPKEFYTLFVAEGRPA
jgi:hypothetical protein